jgi:hypothetical protein
LQATQSVRLRWLTLTRFFQSMARSGRSNSMANISARKRAVYSKKTEPYKAIISMLLEDEEKSLFAISTSEKRGLQYFELADKMLNLASYYIVISNISQEILGLRNSEALDEGRKSVCKAIIYLENVVTNLVDAPYSEFEDKTQEIALVDPIRRFAVVQKMGIAMALLKAAFGEKNKWFWYFVELEGRFAAIAKNLLDWKLAASNVDPESPFYEPTFYHTHIIEKLLNQAADNYRLRYETVSKDIEDLKNAVRFLAALYRFFRTLGEKSDAEQIKKKLDVWVAQLDKRTSRYRIL